MNIILFLILLQIVLILILYFLSKPCHNEQNTILPLDEIQYINRLNTPLQKCSIVFVGVCRNIEKDLDNTFKVIDEFKTMVDKHYIIIFEEGSSDNTRNKLLEYQKKNVNVYLILEEKNNHPSRTVRIAHARNQILKYIRDNPNIFSSFDYMLNMDLDGVNGGDTLVTKTFSKALQTIQSNDNVIAVFPVNKGHNYYDYWALKITPYILQNYCWDSSPLERLKVQEMVKTIIQKAKSTNQLFKVDSAFNGYGLYEMWSILKSNAIYDGITCEHVFFNTCLQKLFPNKIMVIDPLWEIDFKNH